MNLKIKSSKTLWLVLTLIISSIIAQGFAQQAKEKKDHDKDEKPSNLKILDKNIGGEELHKIMKMYSKSLGVRCGFCHVANPPLTPGGKPQMDFASDDKPEKKVAREMMKMTEAINKKYIEGMVDKDYGQITCVTCHMGRETPVNNVDSLQTFQPHILGPKK